MSDALETMSKIMEGDAASKQPVLITGPAACGKSTLTKQYAHRLATAFLARKGDIVPLLVTVVELAATIKARGLAPTDDIIGEHIRRIHHTNTALADFLAARREERKLVVVLDGVDEAGAVRTVLEPYVAKRLAQEVMLCVTGRENGIEDMEIFAGFAHFHIQALSPNQQRYIVKRRMEAAAGLRKGEVTIDERVCGRVARGALPFVCVATVIDWSGCDLGCSRSACSQSQSHAWVLAPRWVHSWESLAASTRTARSARRRCYSI